MFWAHKKECGIVDGLWCKFANGWVCCPLEESANSTVAGLDANSIYEVFNSTILEFSCIGMVITKEIVGNSAIVSLELSSVLKAMFVSCFFNSKCCVFSAQ